MQRIEVRFTDDKGFFYAGEHVSGHIIVELDTALQCQTITFHYEGFSNVEWTTGDQIKHSNHEIHCSESDILLAPTPPETQITIHPPEVRFPFDFHLHRDLPPSFEGTLGRVRYQITTKIVVYNQESATSLTEEKIERLQVVKAPFSYNVRQELLQPVIVTTYKLLWRCLCCHGGLTGLTTILEQEGVYQNEQVAFSIEVDNSRCGIPSNVTVQLLSKFTYIDSKGDNIDKTGVLLTQPVLEQSLTQTNQWKSSLTIPTNLLPSFKTKCMELKYYFIVNVAFHLGFDPHEHCMPITISSRPSRERYMRTSSLTSQIDVASGESVIVTPPGSSEDSFCASISSLNIGHDNPIHTDCNIAMEEQ